MDQIVSRKHSGSDEASNLALACLLCNRKKGADLGSLDTRGVLIRFFNPRRDRWDEHFRCVEFRIEPLTEVGGVTAKIFGFNEPERILERETLS